ncbi:MULTISPECIES: glucose-1-phosphate adenylyltransferase [Paenibacillus]|uniref:Glucose-1-phosphate adenylyltransferase n=1 Tax=Paenibacillus campinasensis TaxID=66347 RepID=A0A268F1Y2_9BACL|nr:glucose-1-phosphate adenylyltransferase [Paenibacillus campinasensis]MUG65881.1 glucose-1-phosphate adenylyltransferase [Paenibacillus campinasensis]PAD79382.1 glucose-1-phosphate adenylyltransferase [Paenibacillus campinasensis]
MKRKDCIAMLLAGGEGKRLAPLTSKLAKPAVPFGGHYRIIDFPLSNCVNSGIDTVGVLTQYEADSLHRHIGEGDPWGLTRSGRDGISLLPSYDTDQKEYLGTADAIYKNMKYIDEQNPEHVLVLSGDHIYHMDYRQMLDNHKNSGASATISVMEVPWEDASRFGVMSVDDSLTITEFAEKPAEPKSNLASMGIYLFRWDYLKRYLMEDAQDPQSSHDFGKDVIPKMLAGNEPLLAYRFQGYWRDVGTVQSLWEAHMDVLRGRELVLERQDWPMFTRPWLTRATAARARMTDYADCLIHDQCTFEGKAKSSVIFCGAEIGKYSLVKDSVVMPNAKIGKAAHIEHAIIGEGAVIKDGAVVQGSPGHVVVVGPYETVLPKPTVRTQPARLLQDVYEKGRLRANVSSS